MSGGQFKRHGRKRFSKCDQLPESIYEAVASAPLTDEEQARINKVILPPETEIDKFYRRYPHFASKDNKSLNNSRERES